MPSTTLLVKNMVCHRCVMAVEQVLKQAGIAFEAVETGEIHLPGELPPAQQQQLGNALAAIGLELIDTKMGGVIEKARQLLIRKARNEVTEEEKNMNLSTYLTRQLFLEYTYLSSLFSSVEGRSIEKYFIQQRIEKVKELLVYNEMTLSAIAFELDYSSTAHLSHQFKQVTGLTPTHFKQVGQRKRKEVDRV